MVQGDPRPTLKRKGSVTEVGGVQPAGQKARLLDLLLPPPAMRTSAKHREPCLAWEQCLSAGTAPVFLGTERPRGVSCADGGACPGHRRTCRPFPNRTRGARGRGPSGITPPEGWCFPPGGQALGSLLSPREWPPGALPGVGNVQAPGVTRAGPSVRRKSSEFPAASALHLEPQLPGKGRMDGGGTRMRDAAC